LRVTHEKAAMTKSTIVTVLCVGAIAAFASGCGPSKALQAAQEYEKSACACKDTACITDAAKKFGEAAKDMATASSGEADAITKATTEATKIAMAGVPGAAGAAKKP
jgi:hypothetical protein